MGKIKNLMSVLLIGCLFVGCSDQSNKPNVEKENKAIKENSNDDLLDKIEEDSEDLITVENEWEYKDGYFDIFVTITNNSSKTLKSVILEEIYYLEDGTVVESREYTLELNLSGNSVSEPIYMDRNSDAVDFYGNKIQVKDFVVE